MPGPEAEATFIAKTIQTLTEQGTYRYDDFTILIRKHSQASPIQETLERLQIPYYLQSVESSQLDEFTLFLRSFSFLDSNNNISRAINYPSRILDNFAYEDLCDKYPHMKDMSVKDALRWLYNSNIEFEYSDIFRSRYTFLADLSQKKSGMQVAQIIQSLFHYYSEIEDTSVKIKQKVEHIKSIIPLAEDFDLTHPVYEKNVSNLIQFLDYLSLCTQDDSAEAVGENAVSIMTCHRSKGLEFPVVFIPGVQVSQGKEMHNYSFISGYYTIDRGLLEAERRLFYVAMTRAIDRLYITCSADPYIGNGGVVKKGFLAEMPEIVVHAAEQQQQG